MGGGKTLSEAMEELQETLSMIKADGKEVAFIYPEWPVKTAPSAVEEN